MQSLAAKAALELLKRRKKKQNNETSGDEVTAKLQEHYTNFYNFLLETFKLLNPRAAPFFGWHMGLIAEYVHGLYDGSILSLIVNMPPREYKSGTFSVALPAWLLGRDAGNRILCASYEMTLATALSNRCRRILDSDFYKKIYPATIIAKDQNEKRFYETTKHGHRVAVSVGSNVTGRGGNWKIWDDPHNPKKILSSVERKNSLTWWDETWSTRDDDQNSTREIGVMQRLHIDDMTQHMCDKKPETVVLKLPRVAAERTVITFPSGKILIRKKGDILNVERVSQKKVNDKKRILGSNGFAAQEQQEPVPLGGGRIKSAWFPRYKRMPEIILLDDIVQSYDTAQKDKDINNPSACITFGLLGKQWHIINYWIGWKTYPALEKQMVLLAAMYKPRTILVEDKSTGSSLLQRFKVADNDLPALPVVGYDPTGKGDKVMRMDTNTGMLEAGYVALPDDTLNLPWMSDFTRDIFSFPSPKYWEPIDAMSQFLDWKFNIKKLSYEFTLGSQTKAPISSGLRL